MLARSRVALYARGLADSADAAYVRARVVVATGWKVGDRTTVGFVRDFYDALARGEPVTEALRAATLAALRRGAPASQWAAFTLVGDPLVTIPLKAPERRPRWWLATLPALAAVVAVAGYSARRRRGRSAERG